MIPGKISLEITYSRSRQNPILKISNFPANTNSGKVVILSGSILLLYPKQINSLFVGIFKGEVSYYITAILNRF